MKEREISLSKGTEANKSLNKGVSRFGQNDSGQTDLAEEMNENALPLRMAKERHLNPMNKVSADDKGKMRNLGA